MTDSVIPECRSALTADWMQQALAAGGARDLPAITAIEVEDIGDGTGALSEILRCRIRYRDERSGAPESVVVKLSSANKSSLRIARMFGMYKREYNCFRQLAPHLPVRMPALLYGDWEEAGHRFVLVLEDLRDMEVMDQVSGATAARARRAVRGAAELHGQFWNRLERPPAANFLASVRRPRRWGTQLFYLICLAPCLWRYGSLFSDSMRRLAEAYGPRVAAHVKELDAGPQTLTHGDFRLENMFFGSDGSDAFTVIDWQVTGMVANGLYDVAYFMVTSVPSEVRRDIERDALREYHDIVCRLGAKNFPWADCWNLYRRSVLNMLVPCVCACGGLDMTNPRMRELGRKFVQRTLAALEDLEAQEFLPGGGRPFAPVGSLPALSRGAYAAYKGIYLLCRPRAQPRQA